MKYASMTDVSRRVVLCLLAAALISLWPSALHAATSSDEPPIVEWSHKYSGYTKIFHLNETASGYDLAGVALRDAVNLSKVDQSGLLQGSSTFYLTGDNGKRVTITSAAPTRDGGFILSGTYPEFYYFDWIPYVAKVNPSGEVEWSKDLARDVGYAELYDIRENPDGSFIYAAVNSGEPMILIAGKWNEHGQPVWETTLKTGSFVELWNMDTLSIEQSPQGYYSVIGCNRGKLDIWNLNGAGDVIWTKSYGGVKPSVGIPLKNGGYAIASSDYFTDMTLTLTDALGETLWTQNYGVQGKVLSVEQFDDGGYLIGTVKGVVKTDEGGRLEWAKTDVDRVIRVAATREGAVILLTEYGNMIKLSAPPRSEKVKSLAFDSDSYSLSIGQTLDTVVTAVYGQGEVHNVSGQVRYSSADPDIVAIDYDGNITGLRHGVTTISAELSGVKTSAEVYVYGSAPIDRLQLDSGEYSLIVGQTLYFGRNLQSRRAAPYDRYRG
ncbi:Ig-like domain-containing protein [Paenibacillus humicus]|uniref:Ig-like domain-containing protein n=1 Tax=Paenibacillus humicus TaxID=412861 RepID=UPI003D28C092